MPIGLLIWMSWSMFMWGKHFLIRCSTIRFEQMTYTHVHTFFVRILCQYHFVNRIADIYNLYIIRKTGTYHLLDWKRGKKLIYSYSLALIQILCSLVNPHHTVLFINDSFVFIVFCHLSYLYCLRSLIQMRTFQMSFNPFYRYHRNNLTAINHYVLIAVVCLSNR